MTNMYVTRDKFDQLKKFKASEDLLNELEIVDDNISNWTLDTLVSAISSNRPFRLKFNKGLSDDLFQLTYKLIFSLCELDDVIYTAEDLIDKTLLIKNHTVKIVENDKYVVNMKDVFNNETIFLVLLNLSIKQKCSTSELFDRLRLLTCVNKRIVFYVTSTFEKLYRLGKHINRPLEIDENDDMYNLIKNIEQGLYFKVELKNDISKFLPYNKWQFTTIELESIYDYDEFKRDC